MDIFNQLNILLEKTKSLKESEELDEYEDIDSNYATADQAIAAAIEQIAKRVFMDDSDEEDGDEGGKKPKSSLTKDDDPLKPKSSKGGASDEDKTFRSSKMDELDDEDDFEDEDDNIGGGDMDDSLSDDDFEFDDFDYEDNPSGAEGYEDGDDDMGDGESSSMSGDDYEDGDFDDDELGDEDDYDFGDGDYEDGGESSGKDFDSVDGDGDGDEGKSSASGKSGESSTGGTSGVDDFRSGSSSSSSSTSKGMDMGKGGDSSGSGSSSDDDVDYDDTLDYDSPDDDSLEGEIKDALSRIKSDATSSEKNALDDLEKSFDGDDKSTEEKAEELNDKISDTKSGKGKSSEMAGEQLDTPPSDKDFEKDMADAGFDKKDIDRMKRDKDTNPLSEEDEEKIASDAMDSLDEKAKKEGKSESVLSRTIMRSIVKGEISNMEWREVVKIFLNNKSNKIGKFGKAKRNAWGDKKHLWRDGVLPTRKESSGAIHDICCFLDFSGSVSQPLVFSFLRRVLLICEKTNFNSVKVYGFGDRLSKPYEIRKRELARKDDDVEKQLKDMWKFIDEQNLGGSIENFKVVANEIVELKRKDKGCPIMIFGDGLWGVSYSNPQPPMRLKEICSRYLEDVLALVYFNDYIKEYVEEEIEYLKNRVGMKHVVTTEMCELTD